MNSIKVSRRKWYWTILTLFLVSPTLLAYRVNNSEILVNIGLVLFVAITFLSNQKTFLLNSIVLLTILLSISIVSQLQINIVSIGYWLLGSTLLITNVFVLEKTLSRIITSALYIILISEVLDLVNPQILDSIISFPRRIDASSRLYFDFARPVGFFRESSGLGITLASLYFLTEKYKLKNSRILLWTTIALSFSFTAYLLSFIIFFINIKSNRVLTYISIILLIFLVGDKRIERFSTEIIYNFDRIAYVNISEVKRFIHPAIGFYEVLNFYPPSRILLGIGPGAYSNFLQQKFAYLEFSDLSKGYIINIAYNIFLVFGPLGFIYIFWRYLKDYTFFEKIILIIILFQGIPILHPSLFLLRFKQKS